MNYGKDSVERRHRDSYYSGKLSQLKDLWQQFCILDEEVQQAALTTGLKELVEKFQEVFKDYMASASGAKKVPRGIQNKPGNIDINGLNIPEGLLLSDPDLWQHGPIDLNLGAGLYPC